MCARSKICMGYSQTTIINRRLRGNFRGGICMRAATTNAGAHIWLRVCVCSQHLVRMWIKRGTYLTRRKKILKKRRQTPKHENKYCSMKSKCFVWLWFSYYRSDAIPVDPFDWYMTWKCFWASDGTCRSTFRFEHNQFFSHILETKMHSCIIGGKISERIFGNQCNMWLIEYCSLYMLRTSKKNRIYLRNEMHDARSRQ